MVNFITKEDVLEYLQIPSISGLEEEDKNKLYAFLDSLITKIQGLFENRTGYILETKEVKNIKLEQQGRFGLYIKFFLPYENYISMSQILVRRGLWEQDYYTLKEEGFGKDYYVDENILYIRNLFFIKNCLISYKFGNNYKDINEVPEDIKLLLIKMVALEFIKNNEISLELQIDTEKGNLQKSEKYKILVDEVNFQLENYKSFIHI